MYFFNCSYENFPFEVSSTFKPSRSLISLQVSVSNLQLILLLNFIKYVLFFRECLHAKTNVSSLPNKRYFLQKRPIMLGGVSITLMQSFKMDQVNCIVQGLSTLW